MSRLEWLLVLDERNKWGRWAFCSRYMPPGIPRTGISVEEAKFIANKALNNKYAGSRQLPEAKKGSELGQLARTKNRCEE